MVRLLLILAFVGTLGVKASPEDADRSEEVARSNYVDQFVKFMNDKNVQGKVKRPNGDLVQGNQKTRFNQDDGLTFRSDLTYHDSPYNVEEQNGNQTERIYAFVSPHGKITGAAGSSLLERTAYQMDQKYTKQNQQNQAQNQQQEQAGVKYRSMFKITTKQVIAQGTDKNNKNNEADKVERMEMVDGAKKEIEKVGETSFDTTIKLSARSNIDGSDDPNNLGNGVLLRQAAHEATRALFYSTLANLSQRRMNRGIRSGMLPMSPQISEGIPRCDDWSGALNGVIAQEPDPKRRDQMQQEMKRMLDQCKQMAAVPFNAIGPKFAQQQNGGEKLETGDVQKEDSIQRDERIQLEIMAKAGKSVTEVPNNWGYTAADDKARMTISYDDNQPKERVRNAQRGFRFL